jgi:hypothetical protein
MSESLISLALRYSTELHKDINSLNDGVGNAINNIKDGLWWVLSKPLGLIMQTLWFIIYCFLWLIVVIGGGIMWVIGMIDSLINWCILTMSNKVFSTDQAQSVNDEIFPITQKFINFFIGIKDCFVYYFLDPIISKLNVKTASYATIFFLMLFFLCVLALIIYGVVYFADNVEITTKYIGFIFIAGILILSAGLILYKVKQGVNSGSSDGTSNGATSSTLFSKLMGILALCLCILIFVYANPLKQMLDELSAVPVTIISIAIIALLIMSYNKFYFNKYSLTLAAFIILVAMGIYYNPFSIFTTHMVPSMIMIATVVSILILLMIMHQTAKDAINAPTSNGQLTFITVLSYAIVAGLLIGGGIYAYEKRLVTSDPIFYILILVSLSIIYKAMIWSGYTRNNPYITLLFDVIFYIPCILVDVIDYFSQAAFQTYSTTSKTMVALLVIEIVLLILYLIVPYMKNKLYKYVYIGGNDHAKILVNSPLRVNSQSVIASFMELNCSDSLENQINPSDIQKDKDTGEVILDEDGLPTMKKVPGSDKGCKHDYNYGLSIWFNMDAISPSAGAAYNEATTIFKYGDKMVVKYNPSINTLTVQAQTLDETKSRSTNIDEVNETTIAYTNDKVMLQKWNHLVINYSSGNVDVFLNGKLDGAKIKVLPFMQNDSLIVGQDNGVSGRITGLIYFTHPMSAMSIKYMYEKFKTETPPKFPEDTSLFSTDIYKNSTYAS